MQLIYELLTCKIRGKMRTILLILIIILLIPLSYANVSLHMDIYNSQDSMSMSLDGANLNFKALSLLNPDSINYDNGGSSNQPQAEYSYSLTLNGETAYSSAKTNSGGFAWSGKAMSNDDGKMLKVAAMSAVKDGKLTTNYGNNKFKVQESMEAENSGYAQKALIQPDSVTSAGAGSTLEPVAGLAENLLARSGNQVTSNNLQAGENPATEESQTNPAGNSNDPGTTTSDSKDQGLIYSMNVFNAETGKQGSIDSEVMGQTEAQWITQVGFANGLHVFGAKMRGIALAPINDLGMIGRATNFPTQILPPGKVEISYKNKNAPETTDPFDDYLKLVDSAYANFDSAYPSQTAPALHYYLYNMFQNGVPVEINYPTKTLLPVEQYNLGMAFNVRG